MSRLLPTALAQAASRRAGNGFVVFDVPGRAGR